MDRHRPAWHPPAADGHGVDRRIPPENLRRVKHMQRAFEFSSRGHNCLPTTEIYLNLSPEDVIREFKEKW